jgi:hypothetical protein
MTRYKTVKLSARVTASSGKPRALSQAEACEWFDCTDRTLRAWTVRGLPTLKGPQGKPLYPLPDSNVWALAFRAMCAEDPRHRSGPPHLTMEEADAWHLGSQMKEWPEDFAVVPLALDHPMRQQQLELAAKGNEPPSADEDDE